MARHLPADQAAARLRQQARTARRKGRPLSTMTRHLWGWEVLVTNIPQEHRTMHEAWCVDRVRWHIELVCKLWKQHGKFATSHGRQPARVLAELYAKLMGLRIQHWLLLAGCWGMPDRSLVKAARIVRRWAERLIRAVTQGEQLTSTLTELLAALQRAGRQTRRTAAPGTWALLGGKPTTVT